MTENRRVIIIKYNTLNLEISNHVAVITFCRPEKFNMLDIDVWSEMLDCQERIIEDGDVRAVLLCAEGKHFSSGLDMEFLSTLPPKEIRKILQKYQQAYYGFAELDMPVIAAVQGKCLGNAAEMLLSCDLIIAEENAKFAFLEVKYAGISPDFGGTAKLSRLVGIGQAKRLLLTGEMISAEEALRIGLIQYVSSAEELRSSALKLAMSIAQQPPLGVMAAKKGIELAAEGGVASGRIYEQLQASFCSSSRDFHEAIAASRQRRPGEYKGE